MASRQPNNYTFVPIQVLPGISPLADNTALSTQNWIDGRRIRFERGRPEKLGGSEIFSFDDDNTVEGCPRNIYSQTINGLAITLIGTNTRLYALIGTQLTNITPLDTSTTVIANSLDSNFTTLGADPIDTVSGSNIITVNSTAHKLIPGDVMEISGVPGAVNGVPAVELNASHVVRTAATNSYTVFVGTSATSTGSGGGGAVIEETSIITVNKATHGLLDGDRIGLTLAATFAGIPAGDINIEHVIRNSQTNTFDIVVATIATSSVAGGGGALTEIQEPIASGNCDASFGRGYGLGRYGVGRYGVSKSSTGLITFPRIWSFDRFGNTVVLTPGTQTGLYDWDGNTATAPALVTNAPTAINYVFVSDNIIVTMGASGVENRLQWSDLGNSTIWTPTAENFAGQDDIEGADMFRSQAAARGTNVLFTSKLKYTFRFRGDRVFVWNIKQLDSSGGILAQNARVVDSGIIYWIGSDKEFYLFSGNAVKRLGSNAQDGINYTRQFFIDNLNSTQFSKSFVWINKSFSEIWFHYPSTSSTEPDSVIRYSITEGHWTPDPDYDRVAAEYPIAQDNNPKLIASTGVLYKHEKGLNEDSTTPMRISLTTNLTQLGSNEQEIGGLIPDSIQTGDITVTSTVVAYPQSTDIFTVTNTITPTTERVDYITTGRNRKWTIDQEVLDGNWRAGQWYELIQGGAPR